MLRASIVTSILPGKSGRLSASIPERFFTIVLVQIIGATYRLPGSKPVFSRLHPKIEFVTPGLCGPGRNRAGRLTDRDEIALRINSFHMCSGSCLPPTVYATN